MYVQRNNGARSRNQSCVEKQQLLRTLTIRLQPSLFRMQKTCAVLYCHPWPVQLYYIFPHYLTNGRISFLVRGEVNEQEMCVVTFSRAFVSTPSHSKKKWARYDHKST